MGYFEIFYAWVKVHMQSVYGSFVKEVLLRVLISIFLFAVYFDYISLKTICFRINGDLLCNTSCDVYLCNASKRPSFNLVFPDNIKAILTYCFLLFYQEV